MNNNDKQNDKEVNQPKEETPNNIGAEKVADDQVAAEQFAKTVFRVGEMSESYEVVETELEHKAKTFMTSEIAQVEVERSIEGVTNQISLVNYLEVDKYEVMEFENDKNTIKGLAFLMADATVRIELSRALTSLELIEGIIKKALGIKNDQVRLENPLTDFRSISAAVREKKGNIKNSDARSIISFLLFRACEDWNLNFSTKKFTEIVIRDIIRDETNISKYIQERKATELLSNVRFSDLSKFGKYTTIKILATQFIDDLSDLRVGLDRMSELDSAFDCVLPRVYSYVMKTVQKDYKQYERGFVDTAAFKFLATTVDIVNMAVTRKKKKTTIPQSLWSFYDNLLQEAIHTAEFIKIRPISGVLNSFVTAPVYSAGKKKKYQIIAKNIRHTAQIRSYFKQTLGDYSELTSYAYFDGVLADLNKFVEHANAKNLVQLIYSSLSRFAENNQDIFNVYLMLDDYDKSILALALADFVYLNDNGEFHYAIQSRFNPAVGDVLNSVERAFITKSRDLVIFAKCDSNRDPSELERGKEAKNHGEGISLASDIVFDRQKRYSKIGKYTRPNYTTKTPFDVFYSTDPLNLNTAVHYRAVRAPKDLFNIDVAPNVVSTIPFLVSPILDTLIRSMQLLRDHLIKVHNGDKDAEYEDDKCFILLSRFFGSFFQPLVDSDSVAAFNGHISRMIEGEVRDNEKITDSSLKARDTFYYDTIVDSCINFGIAMYLLVSFGIIPANTYDTYRVMLHKFNLFHSVFQNHGMEVK